MKENIGLEFLVSSFCLAGAHEKVKRSNERTKGFPQVRGREAQSGWTIITTATGLLVEGWVG